MGSVREECPLVLSHEQIVVTIDELDVTVDRALVCTVEDDLIVSPEVELVLSLMCDKEG